MRELMPHQHKAVDFLATKQAALVAFDTGTGKTAAAIRGADRLNARHILVVCHAIARQMWAREFEEWQQVPRGLQVIRTAEDARNLTGDVVITSFDLAVRCLQALRAPTWDLIIVDEAQALKNPSAKRTLAVYGREGLIGCTRRIALLSGTPMPNNASEIFTHYRALGWGDMAFADFVKQYCLTRERKFGTQTIEQIIGNNPDTMPELAAILRPHMIQCKIQDVIKDLPPLRIDRIPVMPEQLPPPLELPMEVQEIVERIQALAANDAAYRAHEIEYEEWLSRISHEHLTTIRRWTGTAKAPVVVEYAEQELEAYEKLIIFGVFRAPLKFIADALEPYGVATINGSTSQRDRQQIIDRFQTADDPRVLVAQITTASTSLTLHRASRVLFLETSFSPADLIQAARRCHRIGQHSPVYASVISLASSIDDIVSAIVVRKARDIAELEDHIARGGMV